MQEQLKPCPFCGSKNVKLIQRRYGAVFYCVATCNDCDATGSAIEAQTPEVAASNAVEKWNAARKVITPRKTLEEGVLKLCRQGRISLTEAGRRLGIDRHTVRRRLNKREYALMRHRLPGDMEDRLTAIGQELEAAMAAL